MQRREQEAERYQVQTAVFRHRMKQKAFTRSLPDISFLKDVYQSLHPLAPKQNTTAIKPPVSCTGDKWQSVVSPRAGRLWNCWHWLPERDREVALILSNHLSRETSSPQLPLTRIFPPGQQRNIPVVQPERCSTALAPNSALHVP